VATTESRREEGYDLARAVAIVFMVLINFQVFLLAPASGERADVVVRWLAHLPGGRSSSLFVTLAGCGIALMSRGARARGELWPVRRTLLLRALFLLVLGNLLRTVWWIDILHFYAFYLALAALFVGVPERGLPIAAAVFAILGGAIGVAIHDWDLDFSYWSPVGMALDVAIDGIHPVVPWLAFVLWGMWLGQQDLGDEGRRRTFLVRAALVWSLTELTASALAAASMLDFVPSSARSYVDLLSTDWSPAPLYVLAACATATMVICAAHEVIARAADARVVRALVAMGQVSLSIYLLHAAVGVGIPALALHLDHHLGIGSVLAWWAVFVLGVAIAAPIYRSRFRRGPVEAVMRRLTGSPGGGEAPPSEAMRAPRRPALAWSTVALALGLVLAGHVFGASARVDCDEERALAPGARERGELSLLCPRAHFALDVAEGRRVLVEVDSGFDSYLEVRRDGVVVVEDDDSGPGVMPRIDATLPPGRYDVVVRPYSGGTGAFVISLPN
jgi:uncharacterized membrane protein YeiB